MMRVLVTGAGGFLGQAVVGALLQKGYAVRGLYRHGSPSQENTPMEVVIGDIRDRAAMKAAVKGCWAVVHLAGKVHADHGTHSNAEDYHSINVEGTRFLLEGALAQNVQRFVFASSVKVFGETTDGCVDESHMPAPVSHYAKSKWAAEQLVNALASSGRLLGISLRIPMVYGPTEKGNLFRMLVAIDRGWFPPLPRIPSVRSMLHIRNFVQAVIRSLQADQPLKPCYIVTDAKPYCVTTIYEQLCAGLGKPIPAWRIPLWVLNAAGSAGDMLQPLMKRPIPLTRETLRKLIEPAWYCSDSITRDMGYAPEYDFQDALPELVAFYRRFAS
ncbi:MAG: NAD-dependent epimerase/dehydratase family protein [Nitrospirae bacterium]|nr:MAG: NAD-dependent epimerase/dehydratase family protein [Nitrospirota bacterium]